MIIVFLLVRCVVGGISLEKLLGDLSLIDILLGEVNCIGVSHIYR